MGWKERQRAQRRTTMAEKWGRRIREAWNHLDADGRREFMDELAAKAREAAERTQEPTAVVELPPADPENPAYNAAVQRHGGDPLARAALTPTQLMRVYEPQNGGLR